MTARVMVDSNLLLVERMQQLTRDVRRYRSYFPGLALIAPGTPE